jgi:hypothetical protein
MGVIHLRRRLLESVRAFMGGGTPLGLAPGIDYSQVRCYRKQLPKEVPWQEISNYPGAELISAQVESASRLDKGLKPNRRSMQSNAVSRRGSDPAPGSTGRPSG